MDNIAELMKENVRYSRRLAENREYLHNELSENIEMLQKVAKIRSKYNEFRTNELPALLERSKESRNKLAQINHTAQTLSDNIRSVSSAMAQLKLSLAQASGITIGLITSDSQSSNEKNQSQVGLEWLPLPSPPKSSPPRRPVGQSNATDKSNSSNNETTRPRRSSTKKINSFAEPGLRSKLRKGDPFTFGSSAKR